MARIFSLLGDSNIQRNMGGLSVRDRPQMAGAQVIPCGRVELLAEGLLQVRAESTICLLSCVTNFITGSDGSPTSVSLRVEPVLKQFLAHIEAQAQVHEQRLYLVSPPMYRVYPIWYREGLPEILKKFSETMVSKAKNIRLLPSFATPAFESDGVHLTPYSGMEFVLHLFDSASSLIDTFESSPEEVLTQNCEASRVLEDRMMALEQDHKRLNRVFEDKAAEDAELAEFQENIRFENHFIICGLPRIPKCEPRVWQEKAKRDVSCVITALLGREVEIIFVKNITGKGPDAIIRYQVRVESVAVSKEIRDKFSVFFANGKDVRPPNMKPYSIRVRLTHESRIRLQIMRILGQHYAASNPGSKVKIINYESRPLIKLTPPPDASDPRVQTMNYIEAVRRLPVLFSASELDDLLKEIKPKHYGKVKSLFIVLSDDMVKPFKSRKSKGNSTDGSSGSNEHRSAPKRGPSPSSGKSAKSAKSQKNQK